MNIDRSFTIWLTGMSGAGKSTLAEALMSRFHSMDLPAELLDGDIVRTNLSQGLGFSREDRDINVRRIGFVCELLCRHGVIVVVAAISPYRDTRDEVKRRIGKVMEVFVHCPIDVLSSRDVKGLYRRALAGEIPHFTGVSDPYEEPLTPDVTVRSDLETVDESLAKIWHEMKRKGFLTKE